MKLKVLEMTHYFNTVDKNAPSLPCSRTIFASISLGVRHASALSMRNVKWFVSDRDIPHTILGKDVLSALGLDNRALLESAYDVLGGTIVLEAQNIGAESDSIASIV